MKSNQMRLSIEFVVASMIGAALAALFCMGVIMGLIYPAFATMPLSLPRTLGFLALLVFPFVPLLLGIGIMWKYWAFLLPTSPKLPGRFFIILTYSTLGITGGLSWVILWVNLRVWLAVLPLNP